MSGKCGWPVCHELLPWGPVARNKSPSPHPMDPMGRRWRAVPDEGQPPLLARVADPAPCLSAMRHQTVSPVGERRCSPCSRNQRFRSTLGLPGHREAPGDYFPCGAQGTPRPYRPRKVLRAGQVAANPEPLALSAGNALETPFPSSPLNTQPSTINHRSLVTAY
jgi:hypothetical protein